MVNALKICFQPLTRPTKSGPVGSLLVGDKVAHLQRRLFVGEVPAVTHGASEAGVQGLDGVGRSSRGNSRNGTNSFHDDPHEVIIAG